MLIDEATGHVQILAFSARVKNLRCAADHSGVVMSIGDGARLMRASFDVVRRDPSLLWFPVLSTVCLALVAGFWVVQGAYLYTAHGPGLLYVPLVLAALYSLYFVGIFFSVALAGTAAESIDGGDPSVGDGVDIAWARIGGIAGWAVYSLFVALVLQLVKSMRGLRWLGAAAQIAWGFATIFVVPLIALEDLD